MSTPFLPEYLPEGVSENYINPPRKQGPNRNGLPYSNSANVILKRILDVKEEINTIRADVVTQKAEIDAIYAAISADSDIAAFPARP